jgi:hypothetical protein
VLTALFASLVLAAPPSASPPAPAAVPIADAPAAWAPAIGRAQEAGRAFQKALQSRLTAAMAQGGPPAAIDVCSKDAPRIAAETSAAAGVKLGRTSERLRNPANTPPAWTVAPLAAASAHRAADAKPLAVDLGGSVGVLLPVPVGSACLGCHGSAASLSPAVKEALAARYPADRATGYAEGDFRGFLWVEAAKSP